MPHPGFPSPEGPTICARLDRGSAGTTPHNQSAPVKLCNCFWYTRSLVSAKKGERLSLTFAMAAPEQAW